MRPALEEAILIFKCFPHGWTEDEDVDRTYESLGINQDGFKAAIWHIVHLVAPHESERTRELIATGLTYGFLAGRRHGEQVLDTSSSSAPGD